VIAYLDKDLPVLLEQLQEQVMSCVLQCFLGKNSSQLTQQRQSYKHELDKVLDPAIVAAMGLRTPKQLSKANG
jgi:hypothetical protein